MASPSAITARRLLGAVGVAALAHLLCSWGLLALIVEDRSWLGTDLRASLFSVVGLTAVVALITAAVARRKGLDEATRTAPAVFGLLPPIASVAIGVPWVWAVSTPELEQALLTTVPLLATATAPGLAIALTLEHALSAVTARAGEAEALARRAAGTQLTGPSRRRLEPPTLAGRLVRLVVGLAVATCLLVLAHGIVHTSNPETWLGYSRTWLAMLAATSVIVFAAIAAASAGLSPGRDVIGLAARLDAIGWDDEASASARPLASPVRVTSFDAVGQLFSSLERLRARLADDVATYQRALDRTHAADAAKREFLAAVSHELRTPLNSILGFGQLLLETELSEAQAEDIRLILAGGRQLQELIEDILDLSMIESGELELRFAPCKLDALVDDIVDIHRSQVRERGVGLDADIRGRVPEVSCDRKRIGQVVTNLLSNAIKFTEAGRVSVMVRFEAQAKIVSIAVSDTGVGIAAEELDAVFEEYQQAGAPKRKVRGTGLGLAIARRIAEAHGGSLSAESQLGVGSTFTLRLPVEPPEPDQSQVAPR
ncbi:Non-motile and phage-resistance protein [Enhygromyxa salina]|uniref:histidine kinase n=1 Tax=Enhygromyxa salina TaxID=215803 RepID=A0A2S9XMS8_9BACT|nr:Non-motile and phage-resistance protein [Enhygromyxa salina]